MTGWNIIESIHCGWYILICLVIAKKLPKNCLEYASPKLLTRKYFIFQFGEQDLAITLNCNTLLNRLVCSGCRRFFASCKILCHFLFNGPWGWRYALTQRSVFSSLVYLLSLTVYMAFLRGLYLMRARVYCEFSRTWTTFIGHNGFEFSKHHGKQRGAAVGTYFVRRLSWRG